MEKWGKEPSAKAVTSGECEVMSQDAEGAVYF